MHLKNQLSVFHDEILSVLSIPGLVGMYFELNSCGGEKAKLHKPLTLDWTSVERPIKVI